MKFVRYTSPTSGSTATGVLQGDRVVGDPDSDATLLDLIGSGEDLITVGTRILETGAEIVPLADVRLRTPIERPPSFRDCMGHEGHVINCNRWLERDVPAVWYEQPTSYFSNPQAMIGPYDDTPVAPGSSMFDFELEIAAVVGDTGSDLDPAAAERLIAGYLIISDWSARDLQMREMAGSLGPVKGKDTATSLGPYLVTPDELEDRRTDLGYDINVRVAVNGHVVGEGNWKDTYWSFGDMIAYASRGTTVVPGDIIGGGTVTTCCLFEHLGLDASSDRWLTPGDEVHLDAGPLGSITSTIVAGSIPVPVPPRGTPIARR